MKQKRISVSSLAYEAATFHKPWAADYTCDKGSRMSISIAALVQLIDGYVRQKLGQEQGETLFEDLVTRIEEVL